MRRQFMGRKFQIAVTIACLLGLFFTPRMASQTKPKPVNPADSQTSWAKRTLSRLSLEEKVGQIIMPAFRGVYLNSASSEFKEIKRQIQKNHVGGFILFAGEVYESAALIDRMQSLAKLPLLIASDFERGTNFRIHNTVSFPWNMAIGATGSEHWAQVQGSITAQEARAMGVHWILAPVLDVNNDPSNSVINIRSYGEDPELVARLGTAFVRGAQQEGVLATGKHFPGHGDTGVDSHLELPLITADRERLEKLEFVPFRKAIEGGIWSIMTAHLAVPALEGDGDVPATLSNKVLEGVLRQELGFSNLVVTDSLKMAGLTNLLWSGDAAVRAVKAGVDVLLDPPDSDVVYQALLEAAHRGDIPQERLNAAVEKILRAKTWLGLSRNRRVHLESISKVVDNPEWQRQAQQMADESITLVRDSKQFLPLDVRHLRSTLAVLVLGRDTQEETAVFEEELRRRVEGVTIEKISATTEESKIAEILKKAETSDLVICSAFARLITGTGTVGLPEKLALCINQLIALAKPLALISLGNPYIIQQFPQAPVYLCTFSHADVSQAAAVKALFGEIPISGKLPITLPGVAPIYHGVERPKLNMKLESAPPRELQHVYERLKALDSLVEKHVSQHAFPSASVAIGYRGQLVYQKAFGRYDYSSNGTTATPETLYDLASLTKVVTATTLVMQLMARGDLRLEFLVSRFYPSFIGGGRERITLKHLLTHSSGLPAHLPFYKDTQGKTRIVDKILQVQLEYEPGTKAVYNDLGIILLGDILEKVTGQPLDELAQEQIFTPLGMTHTRFKPGRGMKSKIAPTEKDPWRGRLLQGEVHDENAFAMGGVSAHAGLFSNSGDLSVFCQMLLNGGVYDHHRIVRRSILEKFVTRQNLPPGSSRALGWDTPSEKSSAGNLLSTKSFGHTGFTGTSIWVDPMRQLFIIFLTNRVYPTRENHAILEVRGELADTVVKAIEGTE